jgi:AraC-like DNA-binding protein
MTLQRLGDLIERHALDRTVPIGDSVLVSGVTEVGPPAVSMTGTVFVIMAQGAKRMAVGDQLHEYRDGHSMLASIDLPITGHFTRASPERPALGFAFTLRPALIAELLLQSSAARFARPGTGASAAISIREAPDDLVDAATRMVALLDRPDDLPVLAPLIERELTWLLLRGPDGALVRQLGLADSGLRRVGEAVRWIQQRYAEPIRVDDLARLTRMSASAFHRSFSAVTAMSPIQFQKQLRLQQARIRLVADPNDVAGAAYAVGYESASQFSRDYRRRFGTSPGRDALRLRAEVTAAGSAAR